MKTIRKMRLYIFIGVVYSQPHTEEIHDNNSLCDIYHSSDNHDSDHQAIILKFVRGAQRR
jgi:hypothetical protein